jgi:hypothetical protein
MSKTKFNRNRELAKARDFLNRDGYPRLEMFLLVSFTGMAGFFASYVLLHFGLTTMWVRYLVSIGFAYAIFMGMLGLWLQWKTRDKSSSNDVEDAIDMVSGDWVPSFSRGSANNPYSGGGGKFSGGGASVDYSADVSSSGEGVGVMGEALGAAAQAEEGAIPIIVIGALLAALLSIFLVVFSLVYSAPILFSELLVDGMLSVSLYRRLSGLDSRHWLESAIKRTVWPFVFAAVIFAVAGWTMAHFVPDSHSLGEIITMMIKHK